MKYTNLFLGIAAAGLSLTSCSEKEEQVYSGYQEGQFSSDLEWVFAEPGKNNPHSVEVWLLKPAEQDLNVPVRVSKNTRPASFFINGKSYMEGEEFMMQVKKGSLVGKANVTTSASYYNTAFDTIECTLADPLFGRTDGISYLVTKTQVAYCSYCPMAATDVDSLAGSYMDFEKTLNFTVTAGVGDTITIDGLYNMLQNFTGLNPIAGFPLKFVLDRSVKPIAIRVAGSQPFYETTYNGADATVYARSTSATGEDYAGSVNYCNKAMELLIPRYIPNVSTPAGTWIVEIKMQ